jgi:CRP-like cAMP-binding protein
MTGPVPGDLCREMKKEMAAFRFLSTEDVALLRDHLQCRRLAAGEMLWREGDPSDFLCFILDGRIHMKKQTEFPGKEVIVGIHGKGSIIGAASFLEHSLHPLSARTLEETSILTLDRDNFDDIVKNHPQLALDLFQGMIHSLSSRLRQAFERLASIF